MSGTCRVTNSATREHLVHRLGALDPELAEAVARDERVVRDDAHAERERPPGDLLADAPEAEDAERLVGELDPAVARPLPATLLERGIGLRNFTINVMY